MCIIQSVVKTIKINDDTHTKLQSIGTLGDTFDTVIGRLVDERLDFDKVILQVRILNDKQRELHLKNPLYYWTSENYDFFLDKAFNGTFREWGDEVLKRIATNDKWYNKVQKFRKEMVS